SALLKAKEEQHDYYVACQERLFAWEDYSVVFDKNANFLSLYSGKKRLELDEYRRSFIETDRKLKSEKERLTRKEHVEQVEIKNKRKEQHKKTKKAQEEIDIQQFQEIKLENHSEQEEQMDSSSNENKQNALTNDKKKTKKMHCTQSTIIKILPDLEGYSYLDEEFSQEDAGVVRIEEANFSRSFFVSILFRGVHQYQSCLFQQTDFSASKFPIQEKPHRFVDCDFTNAILSDVHFQFAAFYRCRFENTDFRNVHFFKVKFVQCEFIDCDLKEVDFSKAVMSNDIFQKIDFSTIEHPPRNWDLKKNDAELSPSEEGGGSQNQKLEDNAKELVNTIPQEKKEDEDLVQQTIPQEKKEDEDLVQQTIPQEKKDDEKPSKLETSNPHEDSQLA
ncbi:MAG: hypothetical protein ACI86H_000878, partial [bacterium]